MPKAKIPRIKPRRVRDPKHLARVAALPCCVCGVQPVEVHHIRVHGGMGRKAGDDEVIPLCPACHRTSDHAFHVLGTRAWEARFGAQVEHLAKTLQKLRVAFRQEVQDTIQATLEQPNGMVLDIEVRP